ncbi:MAG: hypothetical protein ABI852_01040 [Gemmatimonadaceae bacterium]
MSPLAIVLLIAVVATVAMLGSPQTRARLAVWRQLRKEERENRVNRRPSRRSLESYHQAVAGDGASIDDRTWSDLDLDQVFTELDHTLSRPGQQYLRHLLRTPQSPDALRHFDRAIEELTSDTKSARTIRRALAQVDDPRASFLVDLIFSPLPDRPALWWMFPILTLSAIGFVVGAFFDARSLFGLVAVCAINICLQLLYRPRVEALLPAIYKVPAFLKSARTIGAIRSDILAETRQMLTTGFTELFVLRRATSWLKFEPSQSANELLAMMYTYVNMLLLVDVNAFVFAINSARRARPTLQRVFNAMGYIDAAQSVAYWRTTLPHWCVPEFTRESKWLDVAGVVHPLVTNAVPNELTINNSSALITGSNMSGKTTFVRALGINAILAQTLSTALATRWNAPYLAVGSSIGRADSVLEGKSYYLAEVESIRALIESKGDGRQHLFLIDELFRGTNTAERVAGAYGVLEYLNRGTDMVVVATHDTELLGLLGNTYAPHHFREEVSIDGLSFDFIMRDGQATTRNAIALLEIMKYPAEIVANARKVLG